MIAKGKAIAHGTNAIRYVMREGKLDCLLGTNLIEGRTPDEIIDADLYFIDRIGLRENLSPTRANGLLAMIKQMKLYALAYKSKM